MIKQVLLFIFRKYPLNPMNHFYFSLLTLITLSPFVSFSQAVKKETSLERIEDSTANVKRFDLVNYQILADQIYYKNNPEAKNIANLTALDEQIGTVKSAEHLADAQKASKEEIPYDQRATYTMDNEVALDTKLKISAEDKASSKGMDTYTDNSSYEKQASKHSSTEQDTQETKKVETVEVIPLVKETGEVTQEKLVVATVNETTTVSSPTTTDSLKVIVKSTTYTSTIDFKDNNNVVPAEKRMPDTKTVEPTPAVIEPTPVVVEPTPIPTPKETVKSTSNPAINREQQVIDGLINSGNYDVYDDGKYIKIARKKKIK
jgi:hypothetical protein